MNVLIVGSGGREHALAWKLRQSASVEKLYCAPGNPGTEAVATNVALRPGDRAGLIAFARKEKIGLTVIGPEQPLADGIVDAFEREGLRIFGPTRRAAELEGSKAFSKDFMRRHRIPTAAYAIFPPARAADAVAYSASCALPVVVKADGLAAGKGVFVCPTREEALLAIAALNDTSQFGDAGKTIVIEEFLEGEEASVFAVTDGEGFVTLAPAQDHKRALDGDAGKNTGGMGAYAPAPCVTPAVLQQVRKEIIVPTLTGMASEGRLFRGCLYVGLMLTPSGPKVVEYNCRFGDPETQVVVPLYHGDFAALLRAACEGKIDDVKEVPLTRSSAVCVVLASEGYPDASPSGKIISGLDRAAALPGVVVFHAGTRREANGTIVTAGGRVLGVTAVKEDGPFSGTIHAAYEAVECIGFEGMHFRHDIGKRAL